ncbi:GNAT family N-acetyltransferase [Xenococcus sp. PCC 7305]|uniref:GNAT family N-acetyltransferase n=1 Tax=Xenococcus sp. PCC 7305 TaxID=102125 RepID=UPI000592C490|nr:GNAT family N-acetyltransferase [Xenococcus sp. PCC 7305]
MTLSIPEKNQLIVRPLQYRDLEAMEDLISQGQGQELSQRLVSVDRDLKQVRSWYGLRQFLSILPYSYQKDRRIYVAEREQKILGLIQVSPFNRTETTWRVERVLVSESLPELETLASQKEVGSQLLRYCLENIWEARTWMLEVNVNDKHKLALYRENGFQPLAQMTYWRLPSPLIAKLAQQNSSLPNLLPISNADAPLLYQLDCVSMPPLLRQIFDRDVHDFKTGFVEAIIGKILQWLGKSEEFKGYIFEPQRKAAIGYFRLRSYPEAANAYQAKLTVNAAYTWLYPELIVQMAQIAYESAAKSSNLEDLTCSLPSLELVSADYQPEREEFLTEIGASPIEHTLLMSRSVWHKIRETKRLEGLQLSEVLQGLKPARTPIPSRISILKSQSQDRDSSNNEDNSTGSSNLKPKT